MGQGQALPRRTGEAGAFRFVFRLPRLGGAAQASLCYRGEREGNDSRQREGIHEVGHGAVQGDQLSTAIVPNQWRRLRSASAQGAGVFCGNP